VSHTGSKAVVRVDAGKSLPCEVVNASSGGYGIAVPAADAAAFPPGRIVVLELDDLVVQMKVAHVQEIDDGYYVGLERIGEVEEKAQLAQKELAQRNSVLVRNVAIAVAVACGLLAYLVVPTLLEQFQGKKKRAGAAPAAISVPPLLR